MTKERGPMLGKRDSTREESVIKEIERIVV